MNESTSKAAGLTRRRLTKGLAWTVPATVVATSAPAIAASNAGCPEIPTSMDDWSLTTTGSINDAPTGWENGWFYMITDAESDDVTATMTFTSSIPVLAGRTYEFSFYVQTGKGYREGCETVPTSVDITAEIGEQVTSLVSATTSPANAGSRDVVEPPAECVDGEGVGGWGADGVVGGSTTFTATVSPTVSGDLELSMRFEIPPTVLRGNNDDWRMVPSLTCLN